MNRIAILSALALVLAGCGRHQRTYYVRAQAAAGATQTPVSQTSPPSPVAGAPGGASAGGVASSASSAAGSSGSGSVVVPPAGQAALALEVTGPGPRRVDAAASELCALALAAHNTGSLALELRGLRMRAEGSLDDPRAVRTALLAEDRDADGRFDRAIDRPLASAGFLVDDGTLDFPLRLSLAPGQGLALVVVLELSGAARVGDALRLRLDPGAVDATDAQGGAARQAWPAAAGPVLRIGGWVPDGPAFFTPGDGHWPHAVRDAQGHTHVAMYQNYNGNSDVWYTRFDGRSFSPVDDVSHSPMTSWNPDLALDASGLPYLVWEAWDPAFHDYAVRFSQFDAGNFGWTPELDLSGAPGQAAKVAISQGNVHVVWAERGATTAIKHRVRTQSGWSAIAEISSAQAGNLVETPALTALPNGDVLAVWAENGPGQSEVRGRWIGAAGGYGAREVLASAPQLVWRPGLLADGQQLYLSYEWGGEVYVAQRGPQGWLPGVNASNSAADSSAACLFVHQGALHAVWIEDESNGGPTATQIAHTTAQGGGFGPVELLTRGIGRRSRVTAVSEGERIRVLWQDFSSTRPRIYGTWREDSRLEAPREVARPGAEPTRPAAARTRDGALAVAYGLDAGGNAEVYVQLEGGPAPGFAAAENVSRSASPSYKPALASVSSRSLWAAWEEDAAAGFEVRVAERTPLGWSTPATLSSATAYAPRLSAGPDDALAACWTERLPSGEHGIVLRERRPGSGAGGATWSPAEVLAAQTGAGAWKPDLTHTARGDLVCAFELEQGGRREVFVATRPASGGPASVAAVASSGSAQFAPRVATAGEAVLVAWAEDGRVLVAERPAGAAAFDPPVTLSGGGAWSVDVAASGGRVLVTWEQWQGSEARPFHAVRDASGWSAPAPLDLAARTGRRTTVLGARGGFDLFWTESDGLIARERRED
ncbi:MAG: hypothetical protein AB7N76_30115 [Planctomycetota bacterium]